MPQVRRTIKIEGKPDQVDTFTVPLNNKVKGPFVNSKVIYDLKKKKRAEVKTDSGTEYIFEVMSE
jgi:hypothetical protein